MDVEKGDTQEPLRADLFFVGLRWAIIAFERVIALPGAGTRPLPTAPNRGSNSCKTLFVRVRVRVTTTTTKTRQGFSSGALVRAHFGNP